jgi:hypothetical protein
VIRENKGKREKTQMRKMICETEKREGMMRIATILTGENWTEINIYRERDK